MSQYFAWIWVHVLVAGCDWHMPTVGYCIRYIRYILWLSKTRKKILQHFNYNKFNKHFKNCPDIVDKHRIKYLIPHHTNPHKLMACLKTHKPSIQIRPAVNNINSPSYETAKFLMKTLNNFIKLPNMYNCVNSVSLV